MIILEPINKEDSISEPQPQSQNSTEKKECISSLSKYYPEYLKYMNQDFHDQTSEVKDRLKQLYKLKTKISPMIRNQFQNFNFKVREESISQQIVILDVEFGFFHMVINVLILDQKSPAHSLNQCESQGTFATIYMTQLFGKKTAIKCHKHKQGTFQQRFRSVVSEYFLLILASQLQAGPFLNKQCGFDIIIYSHGKDSCIEFSMEQCLPLNRSNLERNQLERHQSNLKMALNKLHFFHIIHFDIKPQNICFSPTYDQVVFIDFGTSEIVQENLGYKTDIQQFKGTIAYSSAQMLQVYYSRRPGMVDAYYNDIIGLRKSINKKMANSQKFENNNYKGEFICDKTKDYIMILMKFYLFCEISQSKNGYNLFIKYKSYILANHIYDLFSIIKKRPYSFSAVNIYKTIFQSISIKGKIEYQDEISSYFVANFYGLKNKKQENLQILRIKKQIISSSSITTSKKVFQTIQTLSNIQGVSKLNQQIYFVNLARNLRVDDMSCSFQDKIYISTIFIQKYLNMEKNSFDYYLQKSIEYLFDYSFSGQFTAAKEQILQAVITSVIIYQIKTEQEILSSFLFLLSADCDLQWKEKIVFRYLTAIKWTKQKHKTNYDGQKMEYLLWSSTEQFVNANQNTEQLSILKFLVKKKSQPSSNQLLRMNKWKMYKDRIIFSPFLLEVEIFILYLSFSTTKQYMMGSMKDKLNFIESLILQNKFYLKNKFSFILFYLIKHSHANHLILKYKQLIKLYKKMFRHFKFYRDFKIVIEDKLFQMMNGQPKNVKRFIEQSLILLKQSQPSQIIKYKILYLKNFIRFNIQDLSILELLKFNGASLQQTLSPKIQNNHTYDFFHKGHRLNIYIRAHIDQTLSYFFIARKFTRNYYAKQTLNKQFIQCVQKLYEYCLQKISIIKCFKCKILSLIEINRAYLINLCLNKNQKNALDLQTALLTVVVKNSELKKIKLQICESIGKFGLNTSSQVLLIHEYLKLTSNVRQYLQIDFISILSHVYIELYRRGDFLQICELIQKLTQFLQSNYNLLGIINYIHSLKCIIIYVQLNKQSQYFFNANLEIIQKWKKFKNPFLALYFCNILKTRSQPLFHGFIHSYIAFSLSIIDPYSRKYILTNYYLEIINNFELISRRKYHFLNKMHYKHKEQYSSINTYLRQLGQNITNNKHQIESNKRYLMYKKCLIRYHQNIGNLLE